MSYIITVDPGSVGTGVAIWETEKWLEVDAPLQTYSCVPNEPDWEERSHFISRWFDKYIGGFSGKIDCVYIEYPQLFGSTVGAASAAHGDLVKLSVMVGRLMQISSLHSKEVHLLEVNKWKGTLPKDVVARRVCRVLSLPENHYPNHVMDAVGMGLALKGQLTGEWHS